MNPDLITFVKAISESNVLSALIDDLEKSPQVLRDATINRLVSEMTEAKAPPPYIDHISSLRNKVIFDAIVATLKEYRNAAEQSTDANH